MLAKYKYAEYDGENQLSRAVVICVGHHICRLAILFKAGFSFPFESFLRCSSTHEDYKMKLKVSKKKLLEFLPKSVRVPANVKSLPNQSRPPTTTPPPAQIETPNRLLFRQVSEEKSV